jgi:hypothetical protein
MKLYLPVILCFACFTGCKKVEIKNTEFLSGTYKGTFERELVWGGSEPANVTLVFTADSWTGTGDREKYPALCQGTYSIEGDTIIFENTCFWTAEFDWSLILSGKYVLKTRGSNLEFYRDYRNETTDTFVDRYILEIEE